MNISHLKAFLEVARRGSFTAAAAGLNVTQSTVTARIRTLEDQLGTALFQRSKAGAALTAAGGRLLRHAEAAVRAWEQGRQEARLPETIRGSLSVTAHWAMWEGLLIPWVGWMRASRPDLALRLDHGYSEATSAQILHGLVDIGLMYQPRHFETLRVRELFVERLLLVATEPRAIADTWWDGYVHVDWGEAFAAEHAAAFPDLPSAPINAQTGDIAIKQIRAAGGCAFLPERLVRGELAGGQLHRITGAPVFRRPVYAVSRREPALPELIEHALGGLKRFLPAAGASART